MKIEKMKTTSSELESLFRVLESYSNFVIACSGGVDSTVLAVAAARRFGASVKVVHAESSAVSNDCRKRIEAYAEKFDWRFSVINAGEMENQDYLMNPVNRCYFCKKSLYTTVSEHFPDCTIFSGTNTDDLGDVRPGLTAAKENHVVHPFVEARLSKKDIYALASELNLLDLERLPAQPCLASRVETGIEINPSDLSFIDRVESELKSILGGSEVLRCRIKANGVMVEIQEIPDAEQYSLVQNKVIEMCESESRPFLGLGPYIKGSAFVNGLTHG